MSEGDISTITTLFLDIGGVLLTNGWDQAARLRAARKFELEHEELNERHHLTFDTFEEGKLSLDDYLDRIVFYKHRPFSKEDFINFMYAQSQPFPKMIDLVCGLKTRYNLRLAAVNNEGRELSTYRVQQFKLGSFLDFFVSSCFIHIRKPDLDLYRIALDIAQAEPHQVVYIDDRAMFVEVAHGLGIEGIVHSSYNATRLALESHGLVLG
jgi:putative hydrolase of the HAD superfamily